jgi:hypothetical protein
MKTDQTPLIADEKIQSVVVFEYSGLIYNRPIGRGITLENLVGENLEDQFPEGHYVMEIKIRSL